MEINKDMLSTSAYIGGGALAAVLANRLLGNTSTKSNLLSALAGAVIGGGAKVLANPNLDMSSTVNNIDAKINAVDSMVEDYKPKNGESKPSWILPWLTSPLTMGKDLLIGSDTTPEQRAELRERLRDLKRSTRNATPKQRKEIARLENIISRDDAVDERQGDARWTAIGTLAGGGVSVPYGVKLQKYVDKALAPQNVKLYNKWMEGVAQGGNTNITDMRKVLVAAQGAATDSKNRINDILKRKAKPTKQTLKDLWSVLSRQELKASKDLTLLADIENYRLNHIKPKGTLTAADDAATYLKLLLKHKISPSKLYALNNRVRKLPFRGTAATVLGLGLLGGSLLASGLSNYPGSKNKVAEY